MKYSKHDYEATISAFDRTIEMARFFGNSTFNCISLYNNEFESLLEPCKPYCPVYGNGPIRECEVAHDAAYWQFAKEKFIIENEPEGSDDIK